MFFNKLNTPAAENRRHQTKSALFLILFILLFVIPLLSVSFSEDISAMLPSGENGNIKRDFALLQKAPLAGKILISISSNSLDEDKIGAVAQSMAAKMNTPLLEDSNSLETTPQQIMDYLLKQAPNLTTQNDLKKLQKLTGEAAIDRSLSDAKRRLMSPAGIGMRGIIAADPLNLRTIYLPKIASMQNLPRTKRIGNRYFVAGKNGLLLIAKTNVSMTDSKNGILLLERFKEIKKAALTENNLKQSDIYIEMLSGHCYTTANASVIKKDILTVSIISIGALILLFFFGFRSKGALSVFLAPGVAIMAGLGFCAFFYNDMSAIVIGFGAVLMGISIDFAVHTYFSLAENPEDKAAAMRKISKPVLFGAATSCASFAALYVSGIPGIKQLSIFSVAGIIAACAYALLFVPRFCNSFPEAGKSKSIFQINGNKKLILWSTGIIFAISIAGALSNNFDTELKNLGYISKELSHAEKHFQNNWSQMHAQSMLFATGKDMETALQTNEKAWADINKNLVNIKAVSIAETLPSLATIAENRNRWASFWDGRKEDTEQTVLESGKKLGFASGAFTPAMDLLAAPAPALSAEIYRTGPLSFIYDLLVPPSNDGQEKLVMTLLPDNKQVDGYYSAQKEMELGVRLVSQSRFKANLEQEMKLDIIKFISCSGIMVALLILGLFRNLRRAILALFPAIFGVTVTFGLLGVLQIPLNIFHIVALPLVIGLGADYGIFMVFQEIKTPSAWTIKAVKISGLTTLAGFGVLVFAKHPSLNSLGATVSIGITAALCCAIFILPQLLRLSEDKHA
ncbi:MMPL family transporter [Maridesulfovibrio salexigens]|uniref:Exporter n=1 Tax=Maridesulfovibrio salexigens (strain ATCC 14822 / DSM 2638 / NCIMB 8403 / VKM B-1763) TaxID=526222 RepID=C6BXP0_MARSD|nr:MMPL family transporter [Maridesulfovibrio salexigens]ACS78598.1 exporter [Maridesulfovibrio salexigens DSM 2638]